MEPATNNVSATSTPASTVLLIPSSHAVPLRVGIDVRKVSPEASSRGAAVEPAAPTTFFSPVLGAGLGGFWKPKSGWTVAAYLFADIDILGTNFTAQQQSANLTVAELWRVRPSLALAFGWSG